MSRPTPGNTASSRNDSDNPNPEIILARERIIQNTLEQHSLPAYAPHPTAEAEAAAYDNMINPTQPQGDDVPQINGNGHADHPTKNNTSGSSSPTQASETSDTASNPVRPTTDMWNVNGHSASSDDTPNDLAYQIPTESDSQSTHFNNDNPTNDRTSTFPESTGPPNDYLPSAPRPLGEQFVNIIQDQVDSPGEEDAPIDDRQELHFQVDIDHVFYTQPYRRDTYMGMHREDQEECERQGWDEEYHGPLQRLDEDTEDGRARWMGQNGMPPSRPDPGEVIVMETSSSSGISPVSITRGRFAPRRNRSRETQRRCC